MNSIDILQKEWAFTTNESPKSIIRTGSFGPCYITSFTTGKCAAMAHIDDCTQVETMMQIVKKFDQHEVCRKDIKAIVIGGWQDHPESYRWGMKVVDFLKEQQFENLSTKNMFKKKIVTFPIQDFGQATNHYYFGAQVDAKGGRTSVVSQFNPDFQVLDDRQMQANEAYAKKYGTSAPELPLKGVL